MILPNLCRSNFDPFGEHDDVELWNALRRTYLIDEGKRSLPPSEIQRSKTSSELKSNNI